jgi:hypothetical protein
MRGKSAVCVTLHVSSSCCGRAGYNNQGFEEEAGSRGVVLFATAAATVVNVRYS